ncbi:MAG: DEAD/DEAH box helicase [Pseudomonadota bacterium]
MRAGKHTLIAAPTGSGKTLAAFLSALDQLLSRGGRARGLHAGLVHLATQSAGQRYSEEPRGATCGNSRAGSEFAGAARLGAHR